MPDATQPSPMVRKLYNGALWILMPVLVAALYVKFTQRPSPKWVDYVFVALWAMIGLQHLLFPNPRWTPLSRYGLAGLFFALSALFLVATIFE